MEQQTLSRAQQLQNQTAMKYINIIRSLGLDPADVMRSSPEYRRIQARFEEDQSKKNRDEYGSYGSRNRKPTQKQDFATYYLNNILGYDPSKAGDPGKAPMNLFGENGIFKDSKEAAVNLGYNTKTHDIGNLTVGQRLNYSGSSRSGSGAYDPEVVLKNSVLKLFESGAQYNNYLNNDEKSLIDNFVTQNSSKGVNPLMSYKDYLSASKRGYSAEAGKEKIFGNSLFKFLDDRQRAGIYNDINAGYGDYLTQYKNAAVSFATQQNQQMQQAQLANETDPTKKQLPSQSPAATTGNDGWGSVGYSQTPAKFLEQRRNTWGQSATQGV